MHFLFDSFFCHLDLSTMFSMMYTFMFCIYLSFLQEPKGKLMRISTMYFSWPVCHLAPRNRSGYH